MIFLALLLTTPSWYDQKLEGWYYFQESQAALSPEEAQFVLELEKKRHQDMLALALMDPTRENISNYVQEQQRLHNQSAFFAETWSDVLANGRLAPSFAKRYFLLLCFKGQEPKSSEAAKVAQAFASSHHWTLKALSLDGGLLEGFDCEINRGLSSQLPLEETPSFYAIDPVKNIVVPLGADISSAADLEQRITERCEP